MIRNVNDADQPDRWAPTDIGLATVMIVQQLRAGYTTPAKALAEIIERVDHRGRPASEGDHE